MTQPWWFSGSDRLGENAPGKDVPGKDGPDQASAPREEQGHDLLAMLAGAQRMVTWAADAVLAPHGEHADPHEHPACLLCRGTILLGDVGLPGFAGDGAPRDIADSLRTAAQAPAMENAEPITWILVRR